MLTTYQRDYVRAAVAAARKKHPRDIATPHEAYGVLAEEVAEFFDEVRAQKPDPRRMRKELLHVAAMAVRAVEDLKLD